jgi:hypothetical protein
VLPNHGHFLRFAGSYFGHYLIQSADGRKSLLLRGKRRATKHYGHNQKFQGTHGAHPPENTGLLEKFQGRKPKPQNS